MMSSSFSAHENQRRDVENAPHQQLKKDSLVKNADAPARKAFASIDSNRQAPMMTRQVFGRPVNYIKVSSSSTPQPFVQLDIYKEGKEGPVHEQQSSSKAMRDQPAVTLDSTRQCQGVFGCSKKVSQKCSFDCCGDCCKLGLGKAVGGICQFHIRKEPKSSIITIQKEEGASKDALVTPLSKNAIHANESSGCQGAPGCCKKPSKMCSFSCCGDCCLDGFGKDASESSCLFHRLKHSRASKKKALVPKCQGASGCCKLVSNKCTFGLCGDCCKHRTCNFHTFKRTNAKKSVVTAAASTQVDDEKEEEVEEQAARALNVASIPADPDNVRNEAARGLDIQMDVKKAVSESKVATTCVASTNIEQQEDKNETRALKAASIPTTSTHNDVTEEDSDDDSDCPEETSKMMSYAYVYLPKTMVSPLTVVTRMDEASDAISTIMCDNEDDTPTHVNSDEEISVITCDKDDENTTIVKGGSDDEISMIMCDVSTKGGGKDESTVVLCDEVLADEVSMSLPTTMVHKNSDFWDSVSVVMSEEEVVSPSFGAGLLSTTSLQVSTTKSTKLSTTAARSMMSRLRDRAKKLSLARKLSSLPTVDA